MFFSVGISSWMKKKKKKSKKNGTWGCIGGIWAFLENTKIRHNSYNLRHMAKSLIGLPQGYKCEKPPRGFCYISKNKKVIPDLHVFCLGPFLKFREKGGGQILMPYFFADFCFAASKTQI